VANPSYTYSTPGVYSIQLIGESVSNCSDTVSTEITLNDPILLAFTNNDSLCITDGLYNFQAQVSGPSGSLYEWDFGGSASTNSSTDLSISGIQFDIPGFHEVQLSGTYENCSDSISEMIYVYAEPTIDFDYVDGIHCAPSLAQFINLSTVDGLGLYFWDFGDGTGSEEFSPSHVYTEVGSYSVGLTVISLEGCIDTLYEMQQDIFTVYPSPNAGFQVNPQKVDVCDNEVSFIDQSEGATNYFYFFDQNQFTSPDANFTHNYLNTGTDYPLQVVYNEYGCSDSMRQEVFVEPFVIYAPNTFIPDGDGVNDVFNVVTDFEMIEWELTVYNRWGELVYKSEIFQNGWDGSFNGFPSQDGVYAYVFKYRSCANPFVTEMKSGFVNLIR
jgi:gliding motility-associated-like protein